MHIAITRNQHDAILLDLDGVITETANMHAAGWKQMFDEYLQKRAAESSCVSITLPASSQTRITARCDRL